MLHSIHVSDAVLGVLWRIYDFLRVPLTSFDTLQDFITAFDKIPWVEGYIRKCSQHQIVDEAWDCLEW